MASHTSLKRAGLVVTVGGSVLLAGPLAGLLSGNGWVRSADSVPFSALHSHG
ncbi:hypothetical protein [Streptomyces sp. XY413]|uniref:hypothetical protein n=1 Tax=Streptomyces sp. XY413 TaxID=1519479 RepID=UPI000A6F3065|nr:hypothetical protein [Streptomyces sp. XY413]